MSNVPPSKADAGAASLLERCVAYTHRRTIQIFDLHHGIGSSLRPKPLGTGVLATYRGTEMVLTASHILDSPQVQERGAFTIADGGKQMIDLGEFSFVRTASGGDRLSDDDVDLAALFLDPDASARLRAGGAFEFTPIEEVVGERSAPANVRHFIHGYPLALSVNRPAEKLVQRTSLALFLSPYDGTRGDWPTSGSSIHIDFDYQPALVAPTTSGTGTVALPEPQGFSGCGIWHLASPDAASTFEDSALVLGGIVHRFNSKLKVVRATRIEGLLHMLGAASPG